MTENDRLFLEWRDSLDEKHWAKYDLAACRLGFDAAMALSAPTGSLIAAAPTMLKALKDAEARDEALHCFDDLQCFADDPETHQEHDAEYRRRRAQRLAIALAEGRTPTETKAGASDE